MPTQKQLYIWRKQAGRAWLEQQPANLVGSWAIIERPHRKRLTIETVAPRADAARFQQQHGGSIHPLPRDWQQQLFRAARARPLHIGKRLAVTSEGRASAATLVIPAGAAFGTGDHATTAMSLRMLERVSRGMPAGWHMLDAGTGSGILALAAARFGAARVLAIDNDPLAISTSTANARRNRIRAVEFVLGDVERETRGTFNVITANLYSDLLATMLPRFRRCLKRDGALILSGVMRQQEAQLIKALRRNLFAILETRRRGKWVALRCTEKQG